MIRDDQVETEFASTPCRLDRSDAAVNADDKIRALFMERGDRLLIEPIALIDAVGYVRPNLGIGGNGPDRVDQDGRRRDAINVIIAIHHDPLTVLDRPEQTLSGPLKPRDQAWLMKRAERRIQKLLGLVLKLAGFKHTIDKVTLV